MAQRFGTECFTGFLQVSPFGPGIGSYAEGFVPEDALGAFDVRYSLGTPFREVLENFEHMLKAKMNSEIVVEFVWFRV